MVGVLNRARCGKGPNAERQSKRSKSCHKDCSEPGWDAWERLQGVQVECAWGCCVFAGGLWWWHHTGTARKGRWGNGVVVGGGKWYGVGR